MRVLVSRLRQAEAMAIWGGLARQPGGGEVLQIYVHADDVKPLLEKGTESDRYYQSFSGDELELDLPLKGTRLSEVWLCIVPRDE